VESEIFISSFHFLLFTSCLSLIYIFTDEAIQHAGEFQREDVLGGRAGPDGLQHFQVLQRHRLFVHFLGRAVNLVQRHGETFGHQHLRRALAFDLIVAWRVLACMKLGRSLPQLSATVLYAPEELQVLCAASKKN